MKKILFCFLLAVCSISFLKAQSCKPKGNQNRVISPGTGQQLPSNSYQDFICSSCFHFVQFGVYPSSVNKYNIRAPKKAGQVWLIEHKNTKVKGASSPGAIYIVKAFSSSGEARGFASNCKKNGLDCWYNPNLSGTKFDLLSITR